MSSRERRMDGNIYAFADASLFIMMGFNKSLKKTNALQVALLFF